MPNVSAGLDIPTRKTIVRNSGNAKQQHSNPVRNPRVLDKYYAQRYRLFHRFDEGIVLDEVSWYSVTPEKIAAHIARRFSGMQVVLDVFSGAGGNSIQFALAGLWVVGIEIDPERIALAVENAKVYGVEKYIEFVQADAYELLPSLLRGGSVFDGIFMSPPWGGPDYLQSDCFDVSIFSGVVRNARAISDNVAILLPRNVAVDNVLKHFGACEIEDNYLSHKLKTVTVYFGDPLTKQIGQDGNILQSKEDGQEHKAT